VGTAPGPPILAARLLHGEGRAAEAVAGLRAAIEAVLPLEERVRCVHLLIGWLLQDAVNEQRARCDDLANLLEQVHDDPHARFDIVKATLPASTAEAAETAPWLDAERHMPPAQLGPPRLAVASMLLVPVH